MGEHLFELIASTAMVAGWLAGSVRLVTAVRRRQRRSRSLAADAERLARLERAAARSRYHLRQESDDPHARWLGAGGAV